VLLLLAKLGADGLTLIEATHVILLAPFLNPAVEAQAVSRVNRIGQTRATTVHKLLVADTVEERLHQLGERKRAR
jgi:E3 ubiquitin-protein ligase SHPRH